MKLSDSGGQNPRAIRLLHVGGLVAGALLLPVAALYLASIATPLIRHTHGPAWLPYELFAFLFVLSLGIITFFLVRRQAQGWQQLIAPALLGLVGLHYLSIIVAHADYSFDYACYQFAAEAYVQGNNIYLDTLDQCYRYPPLAAQVLGVLFIGFRRVGSWALIGGDAWASVFFLYQCCQLYLILAAGWLTYHFGRRLGVAPVTAAVLAATLFLFNEPLVRTLEFSQVNLWLYVLSLGAVMLVSQRPWLAGLLVALGIHIKLIPGVLLPAWVGARRWRAALATVVGAGGIVLLQTNLGRAWAPWQQYIDYFPTAFPATPFRDNSVRGLVNNTLDLLGLEIVAGAASIVALLLLLAWFGWRFWQREQVVSENSRILGHGIDALAFSLLAAPATWEHLFILAIPVVLWALAICPPERRWQVALAAALMLAVPTFDVYPFSYHRLAGLLWLLWLAPARLLPDPARPLRLFGWER